jgi:transposase InsO family protein
VPEAARAAHPHRRPGLPVEVSGAISGLAAAADTSLTGKRVAELLDAIAAERGYPKSITVDNGTEFYSKAMDACRGSRSRTRSSRAGDLTPVEFANQIRTETQTTSEVS